MASHVPYLEIVLKKQLDFEIAHYAQVRSFVETSKWGLFNINSLLRESSSVDKYNFYLFT